MLKVKQALVLISCLHSPVLCSVPRNLCPRQSWRPPGADLSPSACSAMYVFAAFPASAHVTTALAHACQDSSALARGGLGASHLCPAGSKGCSYQHSFLYSKHTPRWVFSFPSFFLVEKKALRVTLSHHVQEARVRLENNSSV